MADETINRPVIDKYELLRNAYYGTGGFETGTYLVQHKRELADNFAARQLIAHYLNYVASVVNSHVDPVFRKEAQRDWEGQGAEMWQKFYDDADCSGYSLPRCIKRMAAESKLYGVTFVVMDNVAEPPATLAGVLEQRALPYIFSVTPDRVVDWKTDKLGRLTSITYTEVVDGHSQNQEDYCLRTWTTMDWSLTNRNKDVTHESGQHNLGMVPVIPYFSRPGQPGVMKPPSEFLSIARTNLHLFNLCSWLSEMLWNQTFAVLTYPVKDNNQPSKLTIGTNNALSYDGTLSHAPDFIAPPADPATVMQGQIDRLIQEIYRMAALSFVTGTKEASSGLAKGWDYETTNRILADFAGNSEYVEIRIAGLFAAWMKTQLEYSCTYPDDFGLTDVMAALEAAGLVKDFDIQSETLLEEVVKKILTVYLPDLDSEIYDKILKEVKDAGLDALESATKYIQDTLNSKKGPNADKDTLEGGGSE